MALKFSLNTEIYIPPWEENDTLPTEDQISLEYHNLTVEDMFTVQRETGVNMWQGIEIDLGDKESMEQYWGLMKEILIKYTLNWKNIIVDGMTITDATEVVAKLQTRHLALLAQVFNHVLSSSSGDGDEEKNLETESGSLNSDSATPALSANGKESKTPEIVESTESQEAENIPTT